MHAASNSEISALSWRRVSAFFTAISVHAGVFLFLLMPVDPPQARARADKDSLELVILAPQPPPKPVTIEPEVKPVVKPLRKPVAKPTQIIAEAKPPSDETAPNVIEVAPDLLPTSSSVENADSGASEDPSYRKYAPPKYSALAIRKHMHGDVVLKVLVGADGSPLRVEIQRSSRFRELDQSAKQAVAKWKFNPQIENGIAVQGWVLVPISFKLSEG